MQTAPKRPRPLAPTFALALALAAGLLAAPAADAQTTQPAAGAAADWKPVTGQLLSKFTADVAPADPLPEYPRPQLRRGAWTNLNGLWDYAITPQSAGRPDGYDGKILVPFPVESALSGVKKTLSPSQALWYSRTFARPETPGDARVLLHFGAVDWHCEVYVNGARAGTHDGGFDPFTFDVTDALKEGDNAIVVRVLDPTDAGYQAIGKQRQKPGGIWYTSVSGIWQTVWMEVVPAAHVESLKITPDVDAGSVKIEVNAQGQPGDVQVTASDGGQQIAQGKAENGVVTLKIPDAKLWTPDAPHLYDLKVTLGGGDAVDSYFAMRKVAVEKDDAGLPRIMLNDKPTFLYGPLDQGWWPDGLYTAPTDAALKYDIQVTKEMGFNMARKHVKVEPARWYYYADQMGLLVWQDFPSAFPPGVNATGDRDADFPAAAADAWRKEYAAMIDNLYNHPSVVIWTPFNESWGQHQTNEIIEWAREYDPTRLVDGPSGWFDRGRGDLHDMHHYPRPNMFPVEGQRASVLGEFGGLTLPLKDHMWQQDKLFGYQDMGDKNTLESRYVEFVRDLRGLQRRGLAAAVYTQTTDVEGEVNGLLTYDREIFKIDPAKLHDLHAPLYEPIVPVREVAVVPTSQGNEAQTWSYTFQRPGSDDWTSLDFDAKSWRRGKAGFGTAATPGGRVRTTWDTNDIWLRRTFTYDGGDLREPQLRVHHDEEATVYLNGEKIATLGGYTSGYGDTPVDVPAGLMKKGENVLAVHCHQTEGGQYIDAGLIDLVPAK